MATANKVSVGIEYFPSSLRLVWLHSVAGKPHLQGYKELTGDFTKKKTYIDALHEARSILGFGSNDTVLAAIAGKQVHVAQIPFKKLPDSEMKNALRFELRQNLPFEAAGSSIGYQWVDTDQLMVVVVGAHSFQHQVGCYQQAGINVQVLDVLPLCVSNSLWARKLDMPLGYCQVCLHVADDSCSLVLDGNGVPFYSRSIQFQGGKYLGTNNGDAPQEVEIDGVLNILGDELRRSLSFYEKNNSIKGFGKVVMQGKYGADPRLIQMLRKDVGLPFAESRLKDQVQGTDSLPDLEYDVALTLGMRGLGL